MSLIDWLKNIVQGQKGLIHVSLGNLAASALGAILWLVLARFLVSEEYGLLNYYIALASITSGVSLFGLNTVITTYLAKGVEKIKYEANLIILFSSILGAIALYFITDNIFLSLVVFGAMFFNMSFSESLGKKNYKEYMIIYGGVGALRLTLVLLLYFILGINGALLGYAIASLLFSYRYFKSFKQFKFEFRELRSRIRFISHNYTRNLSNIITQSLDKLLIAPLFGFSILGTYQIGVQFLMFLSILPVTLSNYLLPEAASGINRKKLMVIGVISSIIIAIIFIFTSPFLIRTLFPNFVDAIQSTQIIIMGIIPLTLISVISSKFLGSENSRPVFISALIFIITQIVTILTLGNVYGIVGLSLSMVIALSVQALYLLVNMRFIK